MEGRNANFISGARNLNDFEEATVSVAVTSPVYSKDPDAAKDEDSPLAAPKLRRSNRDVHVRHLCKIIDAQFLSPKISG